MRIKLVRRPTISQWIPSTRAATPRTAAVRDGRCGEFQGPMTQTKPELNLTSEQAVLLMNAWRRLTAFVTLVDVPSDRADVISATRELIRPALDDLGRLADQVAPDALAHAERATTAWHPNFRERTWRRRDP
jgi:hypothetical protein